MTYKNLNLAGIKKLAKETYQQSGPDFRVFGLSGQLGAGKTAFTKSLAEAMGLGNAKSPTFTIINCYHGGDESLYHIDLYRLDKHSQLNSIGLDEIIQDQKGVVVIEWIDKFPSLAQKCHALFNFKINRDQTRNVTVKIN
jgi:tRNA threonylcarbamoyladenosine biosynthesis protein TsaE